MFIISFPPLFGHEIVAILCGLVWGLWVGFVSVSTTCALHASSLIARTQGIVALGTFLGEIGNFYAFRYFFRGQ